MAAEPARTSSRPRGIPEATVARLPIYLRALSGLQDHGIPTVSSEDLAAAAGVGSAKLRKDLSYLGSYGTRGVGYDVDYLVYQIARELGLTQDWPVVIVGAGNLGQALANYGGFGDRGFPVAALVDAGVTSILNFAPTVVAVPVGVSLRKVDLATELQILSFYQQRRVPITEGNGSAPPATRRARVR